MQRAYLKLFINPENKELIDLYKSHIEEHNKTMSDSFPNSGFDIFLPDTVVFNEKFNTKMINMQIKTEMVYDDKPSPFMVFPRSSISKTELMLSNHTGIIDSGYRGNLMGAFRWLNNSDNYYTYTVPQYTRLLQICHPSLCPIIVSLVMDENELSTTTRGAGGFGSTGIIGGCK